MSRLRLPEGYSRGGDLIADTQSLAGWTFSAPVGNGSLELVEGGGPTLGLPNFFRFTLDETLPVASVLHMGGEFEVPPGNGVYGAWMRAPFVQDIGAVGLHSVMPGKFSDGKVTGTDLLEYEPDLTGAWQFVTDLVTTDEGEDPLTFFRVFVYQIKQLRFFLSGDPFFFPIPEHDLVVDFCGVFANLRQRPKLLITFDGVNDTDYTEAFAYLEPLGLKATCYVNRTLVGETDRLTESQIGEMQDAGWTIGCHATQQLGLINLLDIVDELMAARDWNRERGFDWRHLAYNEDNRIAGEGRAAFAGYKAAAVMRHLRFLTGRALYGPDWTYTAFDPVGPQLRTAAWDAAEFLSFAAYQERIDYAIRNGTTMEIRCNRIVADTGYGQTERARWRAFVDYAVEKQKQGLIDIVTKDEWHRGLLHPRPGR